MPSMNKILLLVLICYAAALFSVDPLISFFSKLSGERDFYIEGSFIFHVYDYDRMEYVDSEFELLLVVKDLKNFYIKIFKPEVIEGVTFVYYSEKKKVYSGFSGKYYVDKVSIGKNEIIDIVKSIVELVTSPVFIVNEIKENGENVYEFKLASYLLLKRLGLEPITLRMTFKSGLLKEVMIYSKSEAYEEYVKFFIKSLKIGKQFNSDEFFVLR